MTPRERWLALLQGKPVDRVPTDYTATPDQILWTLDGVPLACCQQ